MTDQNNPIFQEIDDEIERKRIEDLWRRYGIWVVAAALGLILAAAGYSMWQKSTAEKHQKDTTGFVTILTHDATDKPKELQDLQSFAKNTSGTVQATMATLVAASLSYSAGDKATAIGLYDQLAMNSSADETFRQYAALMSVQAQMDDGDSQALLKRLAPLSAANGAFRYSALEDAAFVTLKMGDKTGAKKLFYDLARDPLAPESLADRASDMARYLDE